MIDFTNCGDTKCRKKCGGFSSLDCDLLRTACLPNLKYLSRPVMKVWKVMQIVEKGVVLNT